MQLSQEEQISLLKSGVFELATIVVSQYYNIETTSLIIDREILPATLFHSSDQSEMQFIIAVSFILYLLTDNMALNENDWPLETSC